MGRNGVGKTRDFFISPMGLIDLFRFVSGIFIGTLVKGMDEGVFPEEKNHIIHVLTGACTSLVKATSLKTHMPDTCHHHHNHPPCSILPFYLNLFLVGSLQTSVPAMKEVLHLGRAVRLLKLLR